MNKIAVVVTGIVIIIGISVFVLMRPVMNTLPDKRDQVSVPAVTNTPAAVEPSPGQTTPMPSPTVLPTSAAVQERKESMIQTQTKKQYTSPPAMTVSADKTYKAVLDTNKGKLVVQLFVKDAPNAVNNFVFLAKEGFYANTIFHRVIKDFMIQGGDPTGTGMGGPGYRFADETITKEYTRGTLAMANAGPNTNGSQFFIMHKDTTSLPKNYVIFGAIPEGDVESFKTLDALLATPVGRSSNGEQSRPLEELVLKTVTIVE
jgi:cyclophilin family peptidyl-prolyl cis-trans isomerase